MGVPKEDFRDRDVFLDYDFENVMFRFEAKTKKFFRKFYGKFEEDPVRYDNDLLNQAMRFGDEITAEEYARGKPRD